MTAQTQTDDIYDAVASSTIKPRPADSSTPVSPHMQLNDVADKYLKLTDVEAQQVKSLRVKLSTFLQTHSSVRDMHTLAANSATTGHWRSSYHRDDLLALYNGYNPALITDTTVLDTALLPPIPTDTDYATQWPPSIDSISNHTLLRYIRARKGSQAGALEQLAKTLAWRIVYGVEELGRLPVSPAHILLRSLTTAGVHPVYDNRGRPVFMDKSGEMDASRFAKLVTGAEIIISHVWQLEQFSRHLCISTVQRNELVDTVVSVHNLDGTSFAHRHLLKYFTQCSAIDSMYYPETAACVYLINAPSLFAGMYNTLIKPFLDATTAGKIKMFSHTGWQQILSADLGSECIPAVYGGKCTCSDRVHDNGVVGGCFRPVHPMTDEQTARYAPQQKSSWW